MRRWPPGSHEGQVPNVAEVDHVLARRVEQMRGLTRGQQLVLVGGGGRFIDRTSHANDCSGRHKKHKLYA